MWIVDVQQREYASILRALPQRSSVLAVCQVLLALMYIQMDMMRSACVIVWFGPLQESLQVYWRHNYILRS